MTLGNRLVAEASEPATRPAAGREEGPAGKRGQKLEQRLCEYPLRDEALTGHLETDRQTEGGRRSCRARLRLCSDRCGPTWTLCCDFL